MLESNLKPQIVYVIAVYVYIQTNIFLQKLKQVILNDKFGITPPKIEPLTMS